MKPKKNLLLMLLSFGLLGFMALFITFVTQKNGLFDIRNRASSATGPASLTLTPNTPPNQYYVNDDFTVDVLLATGGHTISGAGFRISYPVGAGELTLKKVDPVLPDSSFTVSSNVNSVSSGTQIIDFSILTANPSGYSNSESTRIATITFHAAKAIASKVIQSDLQRSEVTDKQTGLDILHDIAPLTLAISADSQKPTVTITSGPADAASVNTTAVTYAWSGSDVPTRLSNTTVPLTYSTQMDTAAYTAFGTTTSISYVLANGSHTFRVKAKDPTGNVSDVVSRTITVNATPIITSINPVSGYTGTAVTISGSNFGAVQKTVKFGTVAVASYTSWKDTQIVVKVPANAGNNVTVVMDSTHTSNAIPFGATTTLTFTFNLDGLTANAGSKTVSVVVKKGDNSLQERFDNQSAVWDSTAKAYKVSLGFTTTITHAANFTVSVKELSRLRKKFKSVTLTQNTNNILTETTAASKLLAGDFDNNNKIELQDFGLMMTNFTPDTGLTVTPDAPHAIYDIDGDGQITVKDIALLLTHLTGTLQISGDDE